MLPTIHKKPEWQRPINEVAMYARLVKLILCLQHVGRASLPKKDIVEIMRLANVGTHYFVYEDSQWSDENAKVCFYQPFDKSVL